MQSLFKEELFQQEDTLRRERNLHLAEVARLSFGSFRQSTITELQAQVVTLTAAVSELKLVSNITVWNMLLLSLSQCRRPPRPTRRPSFSLCWHQLTAMWQKVLLFLPPNHHIVERALALSEAVHRDSSWLQKRLKFSI
jgi:hypothetical protein